MKIKKILNIVIVAALLVVFVVSAFMVGRYFINSKKQADQFDELSQMVNKPTESKAPTQPAETAAAPTEQTAPQQQSQEPQILPEYADVYALNGDMAGWIRIEGTKIDYPVMYTPERPNYYLKRDFKGNHSDWGTIYMREECDINKPSDNITLYGHCMNDGSMFAALHNYSNKDFWEKHKEIFFDTLTEYHVYEIFSVFKTSANLGEGFAYHQMVDAENEKEFNDFIAECKKLSFYDTGITPVYGDKIICLSTCEYSMDNGRLVVAARRIA